MKIGESMVHLIAVFLCVYSGNPWVAVTWMGGVLISAIIEHYDKQN